MENVREFVTIFERDGQWLIEVEKTGQFSLENDLQIDKFVARLEADGFERIATGDGDIITYRRLHNWVDKPDA